ncbi:cofactor assembly of complex C subunit B [Synechococcus sp. PCC 7336]|uniref:cofactor assembly of complex C subunit B n=1 Tax=Synechococcus sp. PCC 7336 TaxID=195250 RepID=UPI0003477BFB|nr:cofactor assembly of complex C subunit B [Synechococcus sp. PCC 7336]
MVIRYLPLVAGILGGSLLVLNHLAFSPDLLNSQSRSDALGVLLSALLVLTGLLWQQVQPLPPKAVQLEGEQGFELWSELSQAQRLELGWATRSLLLASPAQSVVLMYGDRLILRRGILSDTDYSPGQTVEPGTILARVLKTQKPVYLVDLKLYPARVEFDYLPANTQALLCEPVGERGALVLGADAPRSFIDRDRAWIGAIAQKLDSVLDPLSEPPSA